MSQTQYQHITPASNHFIRRRTIICFYPSACVQDYENHHLRRPTISVISLTHDLALLFG